VGSDGSSNHSRVGRSAARLQVRAVSGPVYDHPSVPVPAPKFSPFHAPASSRPRPVDLRRRSPAFRCSTCHVTYVGLAVPTGVVASDAWVCERCAPVPAVADGPTVAEGSAGRAIAEGFVAPPV
jgi:hypothetical protein